MPLYVYECSRCGHSEERALLLSELSTPQRCKNWVGEVDEYLCEGNMERQPTSAAIQFKGRGWTPRFSTPKGRK